MRNSQVSWDSSSASSEFCPCLHPSTTFRVLYTSSKESGIAGPSEHWFYLTAQGNHSVSPSHKSGWTSTIAHDHQPPSSLHKYSPVEPRGSWKNLTFWVRSGFFHDPAGSTGTFEKVRPQLPHGTRWTGSFLVTKEERSPHKQGLSSGIEAGE